MEFAGAFAPVLKVLGKVAGAIGAIISVIDLVISIKEVFVSDDGKTRATGIEPLLMTGETPPSVARGIYDLQGRRINGTVSLAPGLYIIDGRKTLVK